LLIAIPCLLIIQLCRWGWRNEKHRFCFPSRKITILRNFMFSAVILCGPLIVCSYVWILIRSYELSMMVSRLLLFWDAVPYSLVEVYEQF
jgi:hypothetical protein